MVREAHKGLFLDKLKQKVGGIVGLGKGVLYEVELERKLDLSCLLGKFA